MSDPTTIAGVVAAIIAGGNATVLRFNNSAMAMTDGGRTRQEARQHETNDSECMGLVKARLYYYGALVAVA